MRDKAKGYGKDLTEQQLQQKNSMSVSECAERYNFYNDK